MQADCPFSVTLNCPEPVFTEGTSCVVSASFFTNASPPAPFTPASISYRIDDINSGASILAATPVTPATSVAIVVTGAQNALLSDLRAVEEHQMTVEVTDGSGNTANAAVRWLVQRIFPSTTE